MSCAAIRASFTDYKTVKTRGAFQLILEVPIEQQSNVFQALGYPMPHEDLWVAVALLRDPGKTQERRPEKAHTPPVGQRSSPPTAPAGAHTKDLARSMASKERYASQDEVGKLITRAAILARDPKFQEFIGKQGEAGAKSGIHVICGVGSCNEFNTSDEACRRFKNLMTDFDLWSGRLPDPR